MSGSGKSSLAFDTVYAEGQRRYVESLSAYARQFLERIEKPDVDLMDGLAPAIAIKQKNQTRNPRSTVATATEIYDYLRLLFARCGTVTCLHCGGVVKRDTVDEIVTALLALPESTRAYALFPIVRAEVRLEPMQAATTEERGGRGSQGREEDGGEEGCQTSHAGGYRYYRRAEGAADRAAPARLQPALSAEGGRGRGQDRRVLDAGVAAGARLQRSPIFVLIDRLAISA